MRCWFLEDRTFSRHHRPTGATWGLGGTCVNVGCIPKKLMHQVWPDSSSCGALLRESHTQSPSRQAGILGESFSDAKAFGWDIQTGPLNWNKMVTGVQDHIGGINFAYRVALRDKKARSRSVGGSASPPPDVVVFFHRVDDAVSNNFHR